ncbi:helix-turn-helix domain-containing protein, partial [Prauserella halophila]|uniref:helix-turn-helix domain-containing protein n=1 Tax=Prauserella halophila TaxID=185641 RepID=UPI0020A2CD44
MGIDRVTAQGWARAAGFWSKRAADPRKAEFLALRDEGVTRKVAAERVGVHVRTARDWDRGIRRVKRGR